MDVAARPRCRLALTREEHNESVTAPMSAVCQ
jgi:hypothetical protein